MNIRYGVFLLTVVYFGLSLSAASAEERVIRLKDGVVLQGEVIAKEGDVYKIQCRTLGVVLVKDSDIVAIEKPQSTAAALPAAANATTTALPPMAATTSPQAAYYQKKIMKNPALMQSVQSLAQDPRTVELLSDPQIRDAIMKQDVDYLRTNEKFLKFTNSTQVRNIVGQVAESDQNPSDEQNSSK